MAESIRLNKMLADQLQVSRREADEYIDAGRISVNDMPARLGVRVDRETDKVAIDGKAISNVPSELIYLALHKPIGYICSRRRQGDTPTIYELLPKEYHALNPVGRLDKDTSGLLLLTNDGDFAHSMTHPSFKKNKVYYATLDVKLEPLHQQMISDRGVLLDDGNSHLRLSSLADTPEQGAYPPNSYRVEMSEGRNRQIRRTFNALGYKVINLHRTTFGHYSLSDLIAGKTRVTARH